MKRVQFTITTLSVASVGALGLTLLINRQHAIEAGQREEQLAARLGALEGEAARERNASYSDAPEHAPHRVSAESDGKTNLQDDERERATGEGFASNEELQAAYERAYQSSAAQSPWATQAEDVYGVHIQERLPETSEIVSFECRADFCRLESVHDDRDTDNAFLASLFADEHGGPLATISGGFGSGLAEEERDGRVRHTIFIARPGVSLAMSPE